MAQRQHACLSCKRSGFESRSVQHEMLSLNWSARCQYTVTECEIGIGTCLISHVWRHIKNCQESNITKKHKNICDVELGYLLSLPLGKALIYHISLLALALLLRRLVWRTHKIISSSLD